MPWLGTVFNHSLIVKLLKSMWSRQLRKSFEKFQTHCGEIYYDNNLGQFVLVTRLKKGETVNSWQLLWVAAVTKARNQQERHEDSKYCLRMSAHLVRRTKQTLHSITIRCWFLAPSNLHLYTTLEKKKWCDEITFVLMKR